MTRLLAMILLSIQCAFAIEIVVPEDWTRREIPTELPPAIRSMIQAVSPDQSAEVSLSEMDVVMSLDEAAESYVRGMAKSGFQHKSTDKVTHKGHDGRHIKGELMLPQAESPVPAEAYIILVKDSMISAGAFGAEASSTIQQVLGWIDFPTSVKTQANSPIKAASTRSVWEYSGMALVFGAAAWAVFNSISSRRKRKGKSGDPA